MLETLTVQVDRHLTSRRKHDASELRALLSESAEKWRLLSRVQRIKIQVGVDEVRNTTGAPCTYYVLQQVRMPIRAQVLRDAAIFDAESDGVHPFDQLPSVDMRALQLVTHMEVE